MNPSPRLPERDLRDIVGQTGPLWSEARGDRYFMSGGTGFVGRWMLGSLLAADDELDLDVRVTVLSRRPGAFAADAPELAGDPRVTLLDGDIASFSFPNGHFDRVLHLAKEPPARPDAAAPGTDRMLEFAAESGAGSLLLTSSGAVYGPQPPHLERLAEDRSPVAADADPHAEYARGKRAAEALCTAAAASGMRVTIARCFTFLGPYMDFHGGYAAGDFIREAVLDDAVSVTGDGTPLRSYLYASDLAVWLWTVFFRGEDATPYNVGSPDAVSIAELAHLVARVVGGGKPVRLAGRPDPDAPPPRYVPDVTRAAGLGLATTVPLSDAVARTGDWLRGMLGEH